MDVGGWPLASYRSGGRRCAPLNSDWAHHIVQATPADAEAAFWSLVEHGSGVPVPKLRALNSSNRQKLSCRAPHCSLRPAHSRFPHPHHTLAEKVPQSFSEAFSPPSDLPVEALCSADLDTAKTGAIVQDRMSRETAFFSGNLDPGPPFSNIIARHAYY